MEDKHYEELANIRLERAWELVLEAEVLLDKGIQRRRICEIDGGHGRNRRSIIRQ